MYVSLYEQNPGYRFRNANYDNSNNNSSNNNKKKKRAKVLYVRKRSLRERLD